MLVATLLCEQIGAKPYAFDDGTTDSMVDWHLELADGNVSCLEVTSYLDEATVAQAAALGSHGAILKDVAGIDGQWIAILEPRARIAHVRSVLPALLVSGIAYGINEFTEAGCTGQTERDGYVEAARIAAQFKRLGIASCRRVAEGESRIALWQRSEASWRPPASYLPVKLEEFVSSRPSDVAKVVNSGHAPGYLGVVVGNTVDPQLQWYFWDIAEVSQPDRAPLLPTGLRGVLLVGAYRNSWLFERDKGWVRIIRDAGRDISLDQIERSNDPKADYAIDTGQTTS